MGKVMPMFLRLLFENNTPLREDSVYIFHVFEISFLIWVMLKFELKFLLKLDLRMMNFPSSLFFLYSTLLTLMLFSISRSNKNSPVSLEGSVRASIVIKTVVNVREKS